jgi:hypothetical protein
MGYAAKSPKHLHFPVEVARQFGPIADGWGMDGPVEDDTVIPSLEWRLGGLTYGWSQDPREGGVSVSVRLVVAEGVLWAWLDELVVGNRLGVPQDVRQSGFLSRQVESSTEWLRRLHGTLTGEQAREFMESGGARLSAPDLTD